MKNLLKGFIVAVAGVSMTFASLAHAASINDDPQDFYVFETTNRSGTNGAANNWSRSTSIGDNDLLSFAIYYHVTSGTADDVTFKMEDLHGRSFDAGDTESVTGGVYTSNAGNSTGSSNVTFTDDVELRLYNVSWQPNQCTSVTCERSFPGSAADVLDDGINIGSINEGWATQGNMVVTFKAIPEDNGGNNGGGNNNSDDVEIETRSASNVDDDSARLNGEVEEGDNQEVWFAFSRGDNDETPSCSSSSQRVSVSGSYDSGDDFSRTVTGLRDNEEYFFRACTFDEDGDVLSAGIRSFTTDEEDDDDDDEEEAEVDTLSASNIDEDSARLNGELEEGDNAEVWFAFSRTDSTPSCSSSSQEVSVSGTYDAGEDFSRTVTGLQDNEKYYFRACALADDGDIESGNIRSFVTDEDDDDDDDNNGNDSDAEAITRTPTGITSNSATFRSFVFGEGTGTCYFQYGTTSSFGLTTPLQTVDLDEEGECSSTRFNLNPNTTYFYRAVLVDGGQTEFGLTRSFRTLSDNVVVTPQTPTNNGGGTVNVTVVRGGEVEIDDRGGIELTKFVSSIDDERFSDFTRADRDEAVFYKVRIENDSNEVIEDLTVVDIIPFFLELDGEERLDDDSEKEVRWNISRLEPGDVREFTTEMRVRDDARYGMDIESYAYAFNDDFSVNSNEVVVEVEEADEEVEASQAASIFGAGFFPTTLFGWLLLLAIVLVIAYLVSRILFSRNENERVLAELRAMQNGNNS